TEYCFTRREGREEQPSSRGSIGPGTVPEQSAPPGSSTGPLFRRMARRSRTGVATAQASKIFGSLIWPMVASNPDLHWVPKPAGIPYGPPMEPTLHMLQPVLLLALSTARGLKGRRMMSLLMTRLMADQKTGPVKVT